MNFFQMLFESRFEEIFSFCKLIFVKARFSKFLQHKPQQIVRQPEGGWLLLEEKNPSGMFELSSLGISIVFFVRPPVLQILLAGLGVALALWLYRIPSRDRPRS